MTKTSRVTASPMPKRVAKPASKRTAATARKKTKQVEIKELKFRPTTDIGDYTIKLRNLRRFLEEGDKVKITVRFRGRELAHSEIGMQLMDRLKLELEPLATIEQYPKMEGKQSVMVMSPKKR